MNPSESLVRDLFPGPLDLIGDIHGEVGALRDLLGVLGYGRDGVHPEGRRLVFLGDLSDRGPDSPAVIELVSNLVARGLAQCLMGNHELNLLREARKEGNGWYFGDNHDRAKQKYLDSRSLDSAKRPAVDAFLRSLPIALEREDLRVVHAAWHPASIAAIRTSELSALELYEIHKVRAEQLGNDTGLKQQSDAEKASVGSALHDPNARVPLLPGQAAYDALIQDSNPISIVTSGLERVAQAPFFASEKWRMVNRYAWWNEYGDPVAVIVGHYWRWPSAAARAKLSKGDPDLFEGLALNAWFGANKNVFCVDFAVGARFRERAAGSSDRFECRLGAVRWPERELVVDDGVMMEMTA
jgi:hypothetical protein